ncbi:MAG TPA: response regulator transcription factor [Thermomicrobiales bacterium]|nr:response regulator transcription factor [Thermomicrobiales bacterium]
MQQTQSAERTRGGEADALPLVLVVEDDADLREMLALNLDRHGYEVAQARDGEEGLELARALKPDLVVLDLMLPKLDGRQVCRMIRSESAVPILILTALDRDIDVVNGLDAGADDYVSKPFSLRELLARVKALLRRSEASRPKDGVLVSGDLAIFLKEHRAMFHGRELHLPLKEFRLLSALISRSGEVCSRAELLDMVWGEDVVVDPRNVDVHIRWLRERLEGDPDGSKLIQTVHGVGYRFAG